MRNGRAQIDEVMNAWLTGEVFPLFGRGSDRERLSGIAVDIFNSEFPGSAVAVWEPVIQQWKSGGISYQEAACRAVSDVLRRGGVSLLRAHVSEAPQRYSAFGPYLEKGGPPPRVAFVASVAAVVG